MNVLNATEVYTYKWLQNGKFHVTCILSQLKKKRPNINLAETVSVA